jgi:hypothetical protein
LIASHDSLKVLPVQNAPFGFIAMTSPVFHMGLFCSVLAADFARAAVHDSADLESSAIMAKFNTKGKGFVVKELALSEVHPSCRHNSL